MQLPVDVRSLYKTYEPTAKSVVSDISFSISEGTVLALLGPNGAGKTTTVKMIAGLVLPTSGEITILGNNVRSQRAQAVEQIGAVLEGARNLYWRLSAWENLVYFGSIRLVPYKSLTQRAEELLALFELTEFKHKPVGEFSRGMQQKLAIACSLLHDPSVLLLDEPTLGLDVKAAKTIEEIISYLASSRRKSVLLTTHQMHLAEIVAHDIFVMSSGREVVHKQKDALLREYNVQDKVIDIELESSLSEAAWSELRESFPNTQRRGNDGAEFVGLSSHSQPEMLAFINYLDRLGGKIGQIRYRRPTLEEVFLSLTEQKPS